MKTVKQLLISFFILFVTLSYTQEKQQVIQLNKNFKKNINTNFDVALKNATEAVFFSEQLQDNNLLLTSYSNLSKILYNKNENEKSRKFVQKAILLALKQNDNKSLSILYDRLGSLKRRDNSYVEALNFYEKALKIAESNNFKKEKCIIDNNLARLYWITGDKESAKSKLKNNILLAKEVKYKDGLADAYNILGVLFLQKNKDSSLIYYHRSLQLVQKTKNKNLEKVITSNLGDIYLSNKEYDKSFYYLSESERISNEIGDKSALHYINISLGIYFEHLDNFQKAIEKYEKAINIYGSFVDDYQKVNAYWTASGVFYHSGNYKQAYLYQENYTILKDSLFNIEKNKEFDEIRTQYEVEKKNNTIALLEKNNELEANRKRTILISGILLLIPLIILLFFYKHRIKTQQNIRLKEQQIYEKEKEKLEQLQEIKRIEGLREGEEKEKNRIAKELHDGVGGKLAGIKHYLSSFEANKKTHELLKNISFVTKEVRMLSHSLSSNQSLETLLMELKKQYEDNNLLQIEIDIFPSNCLKILQHTIKHAIHRVLQELMHNIYKHSKATQANLSFTMQKDQLTIILEDNGVGFNTNNHTKGIGLKNVEERIKNINGKFVIDPLIQKGTHITIEIPLKK